MPNIYRSPQSPVHSSRSPQTIITILLYAIPCSAQLSLYVIDKHRSFPAKLENALPQACRCPAGDDLTNPVAACEVHPPTQGVLYRIFGDFWHSFWCCRQEVQIAGGNPASASACTTRCWHFRENPDGFNISVLLQIKGVAITCAIRLTCQYLCSYFAIYINNHRCIPRTDSKYDAHRLPFGQYRRPGSVRGHNLALDVRYQSG